MKVFEFQPYNKTNTTVVCNIHEDKKRPSIIICPGGGYVKVWLKKEKRDIGNYFFEKGFNIFYLYYSNGEEAKNFGSLIEISNTIIEIRKRAEEWLCEEDQIAVMGFSAGGHVAGCVSTLWNDEVFTKYYNNQNELNKPNAAILCYGTISSVNTDINQYIQLLNIEAEESNMDMHEYFAIDNHITKKVPPIFVWTSIRDIITPPINTINLIRRLQEEGVYYEAHFFPTGGHGLVANNPVCNQWMELATKFLETLFETKTPTPKGVGFLGTD